MSARDTQFVGFAKALWDELPDVLQMNTYDEWSAACEKIIAQRAYDLAYHVAEEMLSGEGYTYSSTKYAMENIPDLTELSEVSQ